MKSLGEHIELTRRYRSGPESERRPKSHVNYGWLWAVGLIAAGGVAAALLLERAARGVWP